VHVQDIRNADMISVWKIECSDLACHVTFGLTRDWRAFRLFLILLCGLTEIRRHFFAARLMQSNQTTLEIRNLWK
jgi:hypothetical protein